MSLPPFWLKITKQHVIDNFEELLSYLRKYPFRQNEDDDNEDFRQTCRYLKSVADDYVGQCLAMPVYATPEFDIPLPLVVRILATALYTGHKTSEVDHDLLAALVRLLTLAEPATAPGVLRRFWGVLMHCAHRDNIHSLAYNLNDISSGFSVAVFASKVSQTFFEDSGDDSLAVLENMGSLIAQGDRLILTPQTFAKWRKNPYKAELASDLGVSVLTAGAKSRHTDVEDLLQLYPVVAGEFKHVASTTEVSLKTYSDTESFYVRVVSVRGYRVEVETIDPAYVRETGNIFIDSNIFFWDLDIFKSMLTVGTLLPAVRNRHETMIFRLDKNRFLTFVNDYAYDYLREDVSAMYKEDINGGSRWLTDIGIFINIFDIDVNREGLMPDLLRAKNEDLVISCRVDSIKSDGYNTAVKGLLRQTDYDSLRDYGDFERDALRVLFEEFLSDIDKEAPRYEAPQSVGIMPPHLAGTFALLLYRVALAARQADTAARIEDLTIAMLLGRLSDLRAETDYILNQLNFQKALIMFAHGATPASLPFSVAADAPFADETQYQTSLIDILRGYREYIGSLPDTSLPLKREETDARIQDNVRQLVAASNSMLGKIDLSEINRIKKVICTQLGVADEYRDIGGGETQYGVESDFLEFKLSCVLPPAKLSTGSLRNDIELQKWTILKAVCGFLNSMSGGELLIGVTDSGMATGLHDDIELLYRERIISEPNSDRLRQYVKHFVDQAFCTSDGRVKGTAITAGLVSYQIERTKENREILRVEVRPYPWDVVKFIPDAVRPERFMEAYIRTSGASTPLNRDGIREVKLRKINALDHNQYKLSRLMEAMDHKLVVRVKNYFGKNGPSTRLLEPYRIMPGDKAFLAFDLDRGDMRMFKFARFRDADLTITKTPWSHESRHADRNVDIFGMMESNDFPAQTVRLKLSDYAWCLLMEESDAAPSDSAAAHTSGATSSESTSSAPLTVTPNTGPDKDRFPHLVELTVYHWAGVSRFILGLPADVAVVSPSVLADYLAAQRPQ